MKLSPRRMTAPSLGGVLATRQGSLLLALLCSVLAAAVLIVALSHFKTSVSRPVPQATVLVATGEIEQGMTGAQIAAQHLYKSTPVTAPQVTAGALSDASEFTGATASTNILPGQQLTAADFGTISDADQALKPNQRGVEVTISESPGAIDITQAGSRVDIYAAGSGGDSTATTAGSSSATAGSSSSSSGSAPATPASTVRNAAAPLIASNVLVLKPATATPVMIGNQSVAGGSLVLAVPNAEVKQVIAASISPGLYLALRPARSITTATTTQGGSK